MLLKLLVLLIIFTKIKANNECSKVYMTSVFVKDEYCDEYCFDTFQTLLGNCVSEQNDRQFITTFNFYQNDSFTCIMNEENSICPTQYSLDDRVFLNKTQYYGIKNFIFNKIDKDEDCGKEALVIFITNAASCSQIDQYPDLNELFGEDKSNTNNELVDRKTYFLLVMTYHIDPAELAPCNEKFQDLTFTETNNIKTFSTRMKYLNMFPNATCGTGIPKFPKTDISVKYELPDAAKIGISIAGGVVILFFVLFSAFWGNQVRRRYNESKVSAFADEHAKSARHILFGRYQDEWEVTPKELKVNQDDVLGKGAFATVYKGHLKKKRNDELIEMDVAVKFPHVGSSEAIRQDMIEEIGFMKQIGNHENLLVMVGYVKSIENPVICTVFCANGDLLSILRKHELHIYSPSKCHEVDICLLLPDLLRFAIEICDGLAFLASKGYVHRDIAARNVLLTDQMVAKLSDFGLCRLVRKETGKLYQKEGKFPIKHMAYESIKEGEFSEKSDVWSFGILVWEMLTGGKKPFEDIDVRNFTEHLEEDGKPELPLETPQQLAQILNNDCFQKQTELRPTFEELKEELEQFYSIVLSVIH